MSNVVNENSVCRKVHLVALRRRREWKAIVPRKHPMGADGQRVEGLGFDWCGTLAGREANVKAAKRYA